MVDDYVFVVPCPEGVILVFRGRPHTEAQVSDYHLVCPDIHSVVSDGDPLSWSCLAEDGDIRVFYLQCGLQTDVALDGESDDARPFGLDRMPEGAFLLTVFQRSDHIHLASPASGSIHPPAEGPVESGLLPGLCKCRPAVLYEMPVKCIVCIVRGLVLERGPDERPHSLAVILDDRLAQVVSVGAVAVLLPAEPGHRTA